MVHGWAKYGLQHGEVAPITPGPWAVGRGRAPRGRTMMMMVMGAMGMMTMTTGCEGNGQDGSKYGLRHEEVAPITSRQNGQPGRANCSSVYTCAWARVRRSEHSEQLGTGAFVSAASKR